MRPWKRRLLAAAVGALLVLGASSPAIATTLAKEPTPPTRAACEAFADYFQIEFLVAFASAFAGIGDKQQAAATEAEIRDTFHLLLSPKLEQVTRTLADGTDPALHRLFVRQARAFARGKTLLEGVGLSKEQIQILSALDLTAETDLEQVIGDVDLDKQELKRVVKKFASSSKDVNLNDATRKERRAFQNAGSLCGVFPVGVNCDRVVTTDEATAVLGARATTKNQDGTCTYSGPAGNGGDAPELAVDVYQSSLAFDRLSTSGQGENVPGAGDAAVAVGGFNSFSRTNTCGRTLYVKRAEQTVVVAACTGEALPPNEVLAGIANNVLARSDQS
ncbi:MAG: hypothetical protein MUP67_04100 [Acidimicrobiia bacterium]|nr:hypothetical protein [Acidimicrobiia bacterium]